MIAIIIPAHNEEERIEACLQSLLMASRSSELRGETVEIIVVLDGCHDRTGYLARSLGATTIEIHASNVGTARQAGAEAAIASGARWLAFTDADTVVAPDWLSAQLALKADAVCGTVSIEEWSHYGAKMERHFELTYTDQDGHSHIHGANLGVSAQAFQVAGGFLSLTTGEDVALVKALENTGARIAWSRAPRVVTSARPDYKAPGGFGATLERIARLGQWSGVHGALAT